MSQGWVPQCPPTGWGHGSLGQQQAAACCRHSQKLLRSPRKPTRKISKIPFKVLDAPELQDDFYLNLVDWSSLNVLSVGLGTCVYLWSACTSQVGARAARGRGCRGDPEGRDTEGKEGALHLPLTLTSCQQVTRLCDLSVEGDSVTSVGWSERVSAEGSALGHLCPPQEEEGRAQMTVAVPGAAQVRTVWP